MIVFRWHTEDKIHGGNTISPTCVVDRAGTVHSGCRPRITAFEGAIMVNDTIVIACRLS